MENKNFIDIRQQQLSALSGQEFVQPEFGRTKILFETVENSKSAKESSDTLNACIKAGIIRQDAVVGINSLRHESTGTTFVELKTDDKETAYNVSAKIVAPDPRRFLESGELGKLTDATDFTIISGPCLFSAAGGATAELANGTAIDICNPGALDSVNAPIKNIQVDRRLQAYEADSILRLSKIMSAVNSNGRNVELALNIPRVEYYFYVLDAYEKGKISSELATKWFDLVDERSQRIEELIKRRVPEDFGVRRLGPLDCIETKVRSTLKAGQKGVFEKTINQLRNQNIMWRFAIDNSCPLNFVDISHLSYIMAYIKMAQDEDKFTIAVENPEETPIYRNVKKLLNGIPIKMLLLYPHSNGTPGKPTDQGKANNYFMAPSENNQIGVLKDVIRLNK